MNVNRARIKWYRFAYGCHLVAWPFRWLTLTFAAIAFIELALLASFAIPHSYFLIRGSHFTIGFIDLTFWVAVTWVAIFGLLTLISAWFNIWLRYAVWWWANYWSSGLLVLIAGAILIWRKPLWPSLWNVLKGLFVLGIFLKVAAAVLILLVLYNVYVARGRLVILPFANYTGDDKLKCLVEGLAPVLWNEFGRIANLYTTMDEASLTVRGGLEKGLPATVSVEDVGDVLQSAVSPQSAVKFWGIEIPVGSVLRLFGRLARSPRLTGSIHKEGGRLILVASIDGGPQQGASWRVTPEDLPEPAGTSGTDLVGRMMDQLAYRVFADLVPAISQRWQAVRCYAEGLRALRVAKRTNKDREVNLRQAERFFLQALGEDNKFARSHYNLGVVYTTLGEADAAQAAFYQAVKQDSNLTPAYYALALDAWNREDYRTVIGYCEQVIALQPEYARAWDLKCLTERKIQEQRFAEIKAGEHPEVWPEILASREIGAALAWQTLCSARMRRRGLDEAQEVARKCVRGVAVAQAMVLRLSLAASIMEQALYLAPADADLHFELGKILTNPIEKPSAVWRVVRYLLPAANRARKEVKYRHKRKRLGVSHLRTTTRLAPRRGLYWAHLAESLADLFNETKEEELRLSARAACERAMDYAYGSDGEAVISRAKVRAVLTAIGDYQDIRAACEYALGYASGTSDGARQKLQKQIELLRKSTEIRAACDYATRYANDTGKQVQERLGAALGVIGEEANRDAFKRAIAHASDADKASLGRLGATFEVLAEGEIRAACERAINYAPDPGRKAQDKVRAALAAMRQDREISVACERASQYAYGVPRRALERLRIVDEVIGDRESRTACERAMARASRMQKKAWQKLFAALEVIGSVGIRAACERAMNYAPSADKEAQNPPPLLVGEDTQWESSISKFVGQLNQGNEDRAVYLSRLEAFESWLNLVTLLKNVSGQCGGWDNWAYGLVAGRLAQELIQTDPARAQQLANDAIEILSGQHLDIIREQGLNGTLAQTYLALQKPELRPQALLYAQRAVATNPERAWERSLLAQVYWALGEYKSAEAAWNTCLDLNPDPDSWTNIGTVYWNLGVALRDPTKRKKAFQQVIDVFGRALKIIDSKNLDRQNQQVQINRYGYVHYWIGRFHHELLGFDQAVAHLQVAKNMGYKPLESSVYLGWAHMEVNNYDAAEASFREAEKRIREQRKQGKQLSDLDPGLGEEMRMNELLTMTYLLWSLSYSERGVRLEKAKQLARKARRLIPGIDGARIQQHEANYFGCLGYAQLRMGQVDKAVKALEWSVALGFDAGMYIHLAEAYCEQAERYKPPRGSVTAKARECCARAREADLRLQCGARIKDVEDRLAGLALARPTSAVDVPANDSTCTREQTRPSDQDHESVDG